MLEAETQCTCWPCAAHEIKATAVWRMEGHGKAPAGKHVSKG